MYSLFDYYVMFVGGSKNVHENGHSTKDPRNGLKLKLARCGKEERQTT
jgi:hypothetical protein